MRSPRIRFAFRLAIALGIADPITWIDTVDPAVLDRWIAYDAVEPIPDPWLAAGTIAAEVGHVAGITAACHGVEPPPPRSPMSFVPGRRSAAASPTMTPEQMATWAERRTAGM